MNSELLLFALAILFSFNQSLYVDNELKNVSFYKESYSEFIVNYHLNVVEYCEKDNCKSDTFRTGYIPAQMAQGNIFSNAFLSQNRFATSCYNHGYVYTFFSGGESFQHKGNINIKQISAAVAKKSLNKSYYITHDSPFYKNIPEVLCSYQNVKFPKEKFDFFLVNYVG